MPATDPDKLLSTAAVARILGVSTATVRRLVEPVKVSPNSRRYYTLRSVRAQLNGDEAA